MSVPLRDRLLQMLEADTLGQGIVWNDLGTVNRKVYAERLGVTREAISYHRDVVAHFDKFGPMVEPNERKLRRLLEADAAAGTIVTSRANKIHRDHYAEALGGLQNTQYYKSIFEEFEAKLGLIQSTEHRLRQLLEDDFATGSLSISRGGKIDRTHYAKLLGIHKTALTRHVPMFEQFERRRGGTQRFVSADLEDMRSWLENYLSDGRIQSARTKVNRTLFKRAFGITYGNIDRYYPEVGALLAEYDSRIADLSERRKAAQVTRAVTDTADIVRRFPSLTVHQTYKPGSTKARLILALNDCLRKKRMPRSKRDRKQISRSHFANKLGVTPAMVSHLKGILRDYEAILEIIEPLASLPEPPKFGANSDASEPLDDVARQVVSLYPHVSSHQHYPSDSTAKRVVQILNGQIVRGSLERSRGGKINRKGIAMQLGLSQTAVAPYRQIIEDYEDAVGGRESPTEAKIPAMREWFEEQMRAGRLQIRDGKVSRVQFYEQFNLPKSNTALIRYPRVAAVVEEFDRKVAADGYQPCDVAAKLDELKAILEGNPPIDKNGQTINKSAIEKALSLPPLSLSRPPYAALIARAHKELGKVLKEDRLVAFVGGRVFKFKRLVEQGWPQPFVIRTKECFERAYRKRTKDEAKAYFAGLIEILSFIAGKKSQSCQSFWEGVANGIAVKLLAKDFTVATQEYRDHLGVACAKVSTRNQKITVANAIIRHLSADAVLPSLELPLIGFRDDNKTHLRSIAEVTDGAEQKRSKPAVDDYLEFATSMLKQAAEVRQLEVDAKEQGDFTKVLREELEAEDFTAADNPASVILRILDRRLGLIQKAAEALVQSGRADLERGRELLERGEDPGDDYDKILNVLVVGQTKRRQLLRQYFPVDERREQGIANLLKVVAERHGSLYPGNTLNGRPEGQFFQKRALEYGGANKLQAYLLPSQEVVASVLTLYLLESGSNVSVGRTLDFECIETTDEPHHSKVTGYKARAKGKPIFVVLENKSAAIQAMKWFQEAIRRVPNLDRKTKNQLFVSKGRGETFKLIEEFTFRHSFKRLITSIPELAHLPLTPNMLRPSILLKAALESDGRTRLSMAIGQHGRNVHEGYVNKYPTRFLRDTEIRHFGHSLETVVINSIEDVHEFLGVDAESMGRRVEAVMKTGLGTFCRNRNGRPGNEGSPCKSIDCWNDCPQLIVIAKKDEIAILQVWQHSLRLVEGDWIRDQPERWEAVWLPWLCFVDAVEVKMRQSFPSVWREAGKISQQIISARQFQRMRRLHPIDFACF
jgi:hypothetical protein